MQRITKLAALFLGLLLIASAGCDREESIQSYKAPKEPPKPAPPVFTVDGLASWTVPDGWRLDTKARQFRAMTLFVESDKGLAEVIVSKLGSEGFELLPNLNRWRGQIGLPPAADVNAHPPTKITLGGEEGHLYTILGTASDGKPRQLLVAMITRGPINWFFRITGPTDLLAEQRANFESFLKSIKFAG